MSHRDKYPQDAAVALGITDAEQAKKINEAHAAVMAAKDPEKYFVRDGELYENVTEVRQYGKTFATVTSARKVPNK